MGSIVLKNELSSSVTVISNDFINHVMPQANGEFVKVYLMLLSCLQSGKSDVTLSDLADLLSCTEKDITRAFRYWEKQGVLLLTKGSGKEITGITLLQQKSEDAAFSDADHAAGAQTAIHSEEQQPSAPVVQINAKQEAANTTSAAESAPRTELSSSRVNQLKAGDTNVQQILFVAEQYLKKPLSPKDMERILYFYDELHFSPDLIEYLVEYCVSLEKRSTRYIEKVGLAWHEEGLDSVQKAKEKNNLWKRDYFTILKAFGISNRNPIPDEQTHMSRWLTEYGFHTDIIGEAARRTINAIGQPSFAYAEKILAEWHKKHVKTTDDIKKLDEAHRSSVKKAAESAAASADNARTSTRRTKTTGFHNFHERDSVNYDELQESLLKKQVQKPEKSS